MGLSRRLRPELLAGERCAFRQRLELRPGDLRMHTAAKPAVGRGDDVVAADRFGELDDPVGNELGVLDQVGRMGDDAGQIFLPAGSLTSFQIFHSCSCRALAASKE